jgi:hypothetical protein
MTVLIVTFLEPHPTPDRTADYPVGSQHRELRRDCWRNPMFAVAKKGDNSREMMKKEMTRMPDGSNLGSQLNQSGSKPICDDCQRFHPRNCRLCFSVRSQ